MIFPGFPGVLSFFQVFQVEWEPCRPQTCGAAGGAISVWLKVNECPPELGSMLSSRQTQSASGFQAICSENSNLQ